MSEYDEFVEPEKIVPNPDILGGEHLTDAEKDLLAKKVISGRDVDPIPKIPDAPDISEPPKKKGVPGTFKNKIEGLDKLKPSELPVPGQHSVVWGSDYLDDIKVRPVKRAATISEDAYASRMRMEAEFLVKAGIKDPLHRGKGRADRAEDYARWRYKGYVAGEVRGL